MQNFGGRVQRDVLEGDDDRLLPTAQGFVVEHLEHVIGEDLAEFELVNVGF